MSECKGCTQFSSPCRRYLVTTTDFGNRHNGKLVLHLQSQCLTKSLGLTNRQLFKAIKGYRLSLPDTTKQQKETYILRFIERHIEPYSKGIQYSKFVVHKAIIEIIKQTKRD